MTAGKQRLGIRVASFALGLVMLWVTTLTPQELGTPLDDALRRDLTINSLFYNVHTHLVEDHTRLGLEDLSARIARTPLPPRQTFFDDPLRVLRCVRFAARFGLEIEEGVAEAARDPEIQVSRRLSELAHPSFCACRCGLCSAWLTHG